MEAVSKPLGRAPASPASPRTPPFPPPIFTIYLFLLYLEVALVKGSVTTPALSFEDDNTAARGGFIIMLIELGLSCFHNCPIKASQGGETSRAV